jgi:hypothetical protein
MWVATIDSIGSELEIDNYPYILFEKGDKIRILNNISDAIYKLSCIAATDLGFSVIRSIVDANRTVKVRDVFRTKASFYYPMGYNVNHPGEGLRADYVGEPWKSFIEEGSFSGEIALGHEIFHAYQDLSDHERIKIAHYMSALTTVIKYDKFKSITNITSVEKGAVFFANYIRSVLGYEFMRLTYDFYDLTFSGDEKVYNKNMEKINNWTYIHSNEKNTGFMWKYEKSYNGGEKKTFYIEAGVDENDYFTYDIYKSWEEYLESFK